MTQLTHQTAKQRLSLSAICKNETAKYVAWFNEKRLHSSIGYLAPVEYEQAFQEAHKTAATNPVAA